MSTTLGVTGVLTASGGLSETGTLAVTGAETVSTSITDSGALSAAAGNFSGLVTAGAGLVVTGAETVSTTLGVTGVLTASGGEAITGALRQGYLGTSTWDGTISSYTTGNTALASDLVNTRIFVVTGASTATVTMPTAATIISALSGAVPGDIFQFEVVNEASGALTLTAGVNQSFFTGGNTVAASTTRFFDCQVSNSTTVVCY